MVEVREVIVDPQLEVAIAREAAAEREKRARVRLAEAEKLAAQLMLEAAQNLRSRPNRFATSFHEHALRDDP